MPLVKIVAKAGPEGKFVTETEMKVVSDQPEDRIGQEKKSLTGIETTQLHDWALQHHL
jgi:hypothetical protein